MGGIFSKHTSDHLCPIWSQQDKTNKLSSMILIKIKIYIRSTRPYKDCPFITPPACSPIMPHISMFIFQLHRIPVTSLDASHSLLKPCICYSSSLVNTVTGPFHIAVHSHFPRETVSDPLPSQISMTLSFAALSQRSFFIHLWDLLAVSPAMSSWGQELCFLSSNRGLILW